MIHEAFQELKQIKKGEKSKKGRNQSNCKNLTSSIFFSECKFKLLLCLRHLIAREHAAVIETIIMMGSNFNSTGSI